MAAIQLDGQFIDYPIVEAAQHQLAVAEALVHPGRSPSAV